MSPPSNRRHCLLETIGQIIAERGLDDLSFREVASAAGVSIGTVQYYFASKDAMLQAAMGAILEAVRQRSTAQIGTGPTRVRLFRALCEILPLNENRRDESTVYLAFLARAAVTPALADLQREIQAITRGGILSALEIAVRDGEATPDLDLDRAAASTAALIDGLTAHLLTDPESLPPATAEAILGDHLDTLLLPLE